MLLTFGLAGSNLVLTGGATVGLLLCFGAARRRGWLFLGIGLVSIAAVAVMFQWRVLHDAEDAAMIRSHPVAQVVFRATSDPVHSESRGFGSVNFARETRLRAALVAVDGEPVDIPVHVTIAGEQTLMAIGSQWTCPASLHQAEGLPTFLAYVRCRDFPIKTAPAPQYQEWASALRSGLVTLSAHRHPNVDGALLLPGLVLGDTSAQSAEVERALRISGLGHLTAVSGANVAIVVGGAALLLAWFPLSRRIRFVVLVSTVVAFMVVARPSASVVRASAMAIIALTLWLVGQRKHAQSTLLASAVILLLIDPWLALSWGFALSVAATLGLVTLPQLWGVNQASNFGKRALVTALAACVATTPVLVLMGSTPTLGSIPANVLADAFVAPATVAGVLATLLEAAGLSLIANLIADFGVVMAHAIVTIARTVSGSPFSVSLLSWQSALAFAGVSLGWIHRGHKVRVWLIASATVCAFAVATKVSAAGWNVHDWEVMICDVGQGDATLVRTAVNEAMVIDSGGDADLIDRCLANAGIERVSLFVASHFHQDHVGGFEGVVRGREVQRVITSALAQPAMGRELIVRNVPVPLETAKAGMTGTTAGVRWRVLMATAPASSDAVDGTAINSSSVVLLVHTAHWRVLFTGDLETAAQEELMRRVGRFDIDLIKIPHHGSRFQAEGLARWASARVAWASVGANNTYGHPNPTTLNLFRRAGARVMTTMDCGAIVATSRLAVLTERRCLGN